MGGFRSPTVVKTGVVEVPYDINAYEMDDGTIMYDWYDSDNLYETIEEAEEAFIASVGG